MELLQLINDLKKRVDEYSTSQIYFSNDYSKSIVASIRIAVSLVELNIYSKRFIEPYEMKWFEGGYIISREFDDDLWRDIFVLYEKIASTVKAGNILN
jgi:hypothetical protein